MNSPRDNVASSTASFNNPLLSSSLPHRHFHSKRPHHHSNVNDTPLSASIPLPKSHIHRTPSELQLADDTRRAEYEDVRMYARIVVGMQSQCLVSGYIHPLTRKSLQDVLKTKQANTEELEIEKKLHDHYEEDEDCELPYEEERDENSVGTPLPYHPMRRAEYEDVRMYARIVVGMQSQCMVSGYVHPLTRKSLQDILKTKQANGEDLEKTLHAHDEEDEDWELAYGEDGDENSVDTPLPCHPMGTSAQAPTVVKTPSLGSIISSLSNAPPESCQDEQVPEDVCFFSLEL
eukprot:CAMPEP_0201946398 /NCGR_PEP_ID=MMETSP0903-20130614/54400_1 /ASSEMBLY_ACC=CAM_ASM_000552 /TAXON_ID=420261 /ORGANISM="Thalassiosira antarctica, Strain CCMP982" /LENGTH=289 /DNA_ID=CAMNT_0048489497 /DNA_START=52 /DNA_END=921 /DNA_ORIENTATION=+